MSKAKVTEGGVEEGGGGRGEGGVGKTDLLPFLFEYIYSLKSHRLTGPAISSSSLPVSPNPDPRNDFLIFEN